MECVLSTLYGCIKYLEDVVVHYVWMDEEPFSNYNFMDIPDGHILPSTHIFLEIIPIDLDSPSLSTYINETFKELKFESINKLVPTKIEPNSMDACDKEDLSNVHGESQENILTKPSATI